MPGYVTAIFTTQFSSVHSSKMYIARRLSAQKRFTRSVRNQVNRTPKRDKAYYFCCEVLILMSICETVREACGCYLRSCLGIFPTTQLRATHCLLESGFRQADMAWKCQHGSAPRSTPIKKISNNL